MKTLIIFFNSLSVLYFVVFFSLVYLLFFTFYYEYIYIFEWNILNFEFLWDMKLYFYFDFISNVFLLVISVISMVTFFFSKFYMVSDKNKNKFLFFTFLFIFSMFVMVLSMNFILILFGWDGLGVVSYFLIIHYQSDMSNYSGMITILTNRIGDIGMIFSMFVLLTKNCLDIMVIDIQNLELIFLLLISLGGLSKSAQFPFSGWLPLAMAAPTPISALVHSSTLVTAGIYLFIRFNLFFKSYSIYGSFLLIIASITMFVAGTSALFEVDVKKIIALSTMSQLGLMVMIVVIGNEVLSLYHILIHALFKALLFLSSGVFIHEFLENQDLRNFMMIMKVNYVVLSIFFVCSLSLFGFPFLSGFYSKDLILEYFYSLNYNYMYMCSLILMTLLTCTYSLRLIYLSLLLGKKSFKFIFLENWSNMVNLMCFLVVSVLVMGSGLMWMMLEKIVLIYLTISVKLLNILLILMGVLLFFFLKKTKFFYIDLFLHMYFLTSCQGYLSSICFYKINYYFNSELMLEEMFIKKTKTFLVKIFSVIQIHKFLMFFSFGYYILMFFY